MVGVITGKFKCDIPGCPCHEASKHYLDELQTSVANLMFHLARKYHPTCGEEIEDLSQRCFERVFSKLDRFDPSRGVEFITWAYRVAENVLRREHKRTYRRKKIFRTTDDQDQNLLEQISANSGEPLLRADLIFCVRQLRTKYPKWNDVIDALFGKKEEPLSCTFSVSEVARTTKRRYNQVHHFVTKIVRPLFRNYLD
jgi:RNA polymerase sigma factor (sigma-70 family)